MKMLCSIVGAQHRPGGKEAIASLKSGQLIRLVRDPQNEYDKNAVQVWVGDVFAAMIRAQDAGQLAREMDSWDKVEIEGRFVVDGAKWPSVEVEL